METPAKVLEEEEEDIDFDCEVKKQLFLDNEPEPETPFVDRPSAPSQKQPVLIYLRVRPKRPAEILNEDADCLHEMSDFELMAVPPVKSKTYLSSRTNTDNFNFTFSKIFGPSTSQRELFDSTFKPLLKDFFNGQNCLVFTYGVTNSGKSYTITGTPEAPGLLPRTLDAIFTSLDVQQQLADVNVYPERFCDLKRLQPEEVSKKQEWKDKILNVARGIGCRERPSSPVEVSAPPSAPQDNETLDSSDLSTISALSKVSSNVSKVTDIEGISFEEFQLEDDSTIDLQGLENEQFAIFVSFAEIYNEFIYDLLLDVPAGQRRTPLKVVQDRHQNYYIKGLHEVHVSSAEEAMLVLRLGLKYRHVASTRLNYQSSRSHSIYTIKLVRLANVGKPSKALINRISIVDLAGAERSAKTGATGKRVKEAGNINNSLFTLGKCIEAMKHNQSKRCNEERLIPFRDSKLTRLFQNYFVGKGEGIRQGKVTMFVNISNNASVFDETLHVLKFSALTSKVVPIVKTVVDGAMPFLSNRPPPTPRFHPLPQGKVGGAKKEGCARQIDADCKSSTIQMVEAELKKEVARLEVELLEQEYRIRQEVAEEFREQLIEIEEQHEHDMAEQAEELETLHEKRLEIYKLSVKRDSRKRRRPNDDDGEESEGTLRCKIANLQSRVAELEEELALEKNRASAEICDASETYESQVVKLNQQLAELSLQLSKARKNEAAASTTIQALQDDLEAAKVAEEKKEHSLAQLENTLKSVTEEKAMLSRQLEEEKSMAERKLGLLELKVEEMASEKRQWEENKVKLNLEFEANLKSVRDQCDSARLVHADSEDSSLREKSLLQEEKARLASALEQERSQHKAELVRAVEEAKMDGAAESEILQARISELTNENVAAQAELEALREQSNGKKGVAAFKKRLQDALSEISSFREQLANERADTSKEKEALTAQLKAAHAEITSLNEEKSSAQDEIASVQHQLEDMQAELVAQMERERHSAQKELATLQEQLEKHKTSAHQQHTALLEQARSSTQEEVASLQEQFDMEKAHMQNELNTLQEQLEKERSAAQAEQVDLKEQLEVVRSSAEEEKTCTDQQLATLNQQLETRQNQVDSLKAELQLMSSSNAGLRAELKEAVASALIEYKTTLKQQRERISELEGECQELHELNQGLEEKTGELELKLRRLMTTKENLDLKVVQLSDQLEDCHRTTSRREAEIQDASDRCRSVLEDQVATLRKQLASLEHNLSVAKDDLKDSIQQLRKKEDELLALSRDQSTVSKLMSDLEESRATMESLKGQHQLEMAQLSIKLREMTQQKEYCEADFVAERESAIAERATLEQQLKEREEEVAELNRVEKKRNKEVAALNRELKQNEKRLAKLKTVEAELKEKVKLSKKLEKELDAETQQVVLLKEKVHSLESQQEQQHIYEELPDASARSSEDTSAVRKSYLQAVENLDTSMEADRSKPYIPNLEASSQLEESTCDSGGVVIDATPIPLRKRTRRGKLKEEKNENKEPGIVTRLLRSKKKPASSQAPGEDTDSLQDFTPQTAKKFRSFAAKKPQVVSTIATRTRRKLRKDQISGPVSLIESPKEITTRGNIHLVSRLQAAEFN